VALLLPRKEKPDLCCQWQTTFIMTSEVCLRINNSQITAQFTIKYDKIQDTLRSFTIILVLLDSYQMVLKQNNVIKVVAMQLSAFVKV
jgi:hypothetical protein